MPLTSAYWPLPFTSVVQSVFMVVLLGCSMETRAEDQDSVGASNSSEPLLQLPRQPAAAEGGGAKWQIFKASCMRRSPAAMAAIGPSPPLLSDSAFSQH